MLGHRGQILMHSDKYHKNAKYEKNDYDIRGLMADAIAWTIGPNN